MNENEIEQLMSREPGKSVRTPAVASMPLDEPATPQAEPATPSAASLSPWAAATAKFLAAAEREEQGMAAEPTMSPGDAAELLRQAEMAVQSMRSPPADALPPGTTPFQLPELQGAAVSAEPANLDLIRDLELNLKIELGRTQMSLDDVLKLRKGSVVALDKLAGEPVDVYANGRLIARGEVLVLDDSFSVRVVELTAGIGKAA
jgi:flagellar motor switch protein FliN/FliY